jgi:hypothetical protein
VRISAAAARLLEAVGHHHGDRLMVMHHLIAARGAAFIMPSGKGAA